MGIAFNRVYMKTSLTTCSSGATYIALMAAVSGLYGCAPPLRPVMSSTPSSEQGYVTSTPSLNTTSSVAGYVCPQTPNVTPYQNNFDEKDMFTVCTQAVSPSNISVTGTLSSATVTELCAFPAQYISSTQVVSELDPTSGLPAYNCQVAGTNGPTFFNFAGLNFNSVFIVEGQNLTQMQECLLQGNGTVCPNYSFGKLNPL